MATDGLWPATSEAAEPLPTLVPVGAPVDGIVTHYGADYTGQPLGCGDGVYASDDESIIAVGLARDITWPCGTVIEVCGAAGCIVGVRQDTCPGCRADHVDLSEAGIEAVCGPEVPRCEVRLQAMRWQDVPAAEGPTARLR